MSLPRPKASVLSSALEDQTGVLLDLDGQIYFALNETGYFVWNELAQREHTTESLIAAMLAEFDIDEATARKDLEALMAQLVQRGLVSNDPQTTPVQPK